MEKGISHNLEVVFFCSAGAKLYQFQCRQHDKDHTQQRSNLPRPKSPDGTKCGICPITPNMKVSLIEVGKAENKIHNIFAIHT
jgi:hypothetical protein